MPYVRLFFNQSGSSMETSGAYEAKNHLQKLLVRVIKGERITIIKHEVPVAVLQPPESKQRVEPKQVIAEFA